MSVLLAKCFGTAKINTQNYTYLSLFEFLQTQKAENLLWGLIIGYCTVSIGNRMVLNILM